MSTDEYLSTAQHQRPILIRRCSAILGPDYDRDTAEFVVDGVIQDTWVRLCLGGRVIQNLGGYLTNAVAKATAKFLRDAPEELFLEDIITAGSEREDQAEDYDMLEGAVIQPDLDTPRDVQAAMECLTPLQQQLVRLILVEGLSHQVAAEEAGLKWGMEAWRQVKPALVVLREKLQAYDERRPPRPSV